MAMGGLEPQAQGSRPQAPEALAASRVRRVLLTLQHMLSTCCVPVPVLWPDPAPRQCPLPLQMLCGSRMAE